MFPICNDVGEVIAFSGRLLKEEEGAAKYLNSPETPKFQETVLFERATSFLDCINPSAH